MWVCGAKEALFCLLHLGKGGAMCACVHGCVELLMFWGCAVLMIIKMRNYFGLGFELDLLQRNIKDWSAVLLSL